LYSAKEKLKIVSVRGGAAQFCPATPEPRKARRGQNSVRAISRIHRSRFSGKFSAKGGSASGITNRFACPPLEGIQ